LGGIFAMGDIINYRRIKWMLRLGRVEHLNWFRAPGMVGQAISICGGHCAYSKVLYAVSVCWRYAEEQLVKLIY
jgi:hypothetical protein